MASLRLQIGDKVIFEGPSMAMPRAGEEIHHDGEVVRVEAVVWNFETEDVIVTLVVGDRPYTY